MKKLTSLPRSIAISIAIFFLIVYLIAISSIPVLAEDAGFALNFDGSNDYVILGDTGDIFNTSDWEDLKTISVWVNPTGPSALESDPTSGEMILGVDRPRLFGISRANSQGEDHRR